ncbi:hypothetical protein LINPERHAP1_LOCUS9794 [Linum perenne]
MEAAASLEAAAGWTRPPAEERIWGLFSSTSSSTVEEGANLEIRF